METMGIPVVTFGQDEFPSFYSGKSGYLSPLRLNTADEIAAMLAVKWRLGLNGSVLIANPLPPEQEVAPELIEVYIQQALKEAKNQKISGKEITPFLLKFIADHSRGESLEANIALIHHNAALAASIACAMHK